MGIREEVLYVLKNTLFYDKNKREMYIADNYYKGKQEILEKKRETYDTKTGIKEELKFLPNNKIVNNKFQGIIDQKTNYLVSKKPTISSENEIYAKELKKVFNENFFYTLYNLVKNVYLYGIGWLYVNYNEKGELVFNLINSKEITPIWEDKEHENLRFVIRTFEKQEFINGSYEIKQYVDVFTVDGVEHYLYKNGNLEYLSKENYIYLNEQGYNWEKLPIIFVKNKQIELPLIRNIKIMQDILNEISSTFVDRIQQDETSSIMILRGYEGQDLREFRKNLLEIGAVNVGNNGDVSLLNPEINTEAFSKGIELANRGIYETSKAFDSKNDMLGHDPNSMNIQSMYSEIDLDANELERELQKRLRELIWFVNRHLENKGIGNFDNEEITIIFDRDILINETQVIDNLLKSQGILSKEKLIEEHPLVSNPKLEIERLEKENESLSIVNDGYFNHYEEKDKTNGNAYNLNKKEKEDK